MDVLGNIKREGHEKLNGLRDLEEFKKHEGAKNLENPSAKSFKSQLSRLSKLSGTSSYRRKLAVEGAELRAKDLKRPIDFTDAKTGRKITLTPEHLILLEQLSRHNDLSVLTEGQLDLLQEIDFDSLQNLDPMQISQILDECGLFLVPHREHGLDKTSKRMYAFNYHDNSDDYKNLGTLHRDNRTVEYFPQDEAHDFSTRP